MHHLFSLATYLHLEIVLKPYFLGLAIILQG